MKQLIYCFLTTLSFNLIQAQDIHFSQFDLSPTLLNPALTGSDDNGRIIANYRNQWASVLKKNAFNTTSLAYDQPITLKNKDKIGLGTHFFFDKAGQLDFQTIAGNFVGAYHKKITNNKMDKQYLSIGLLAGIARRSINFDNAQWGSQHDGEGGFNGNLPSGENFEEDKFYFFDLGLGISWLAKFENENWITLGGTLSHINRANQSFDSAIDLPSYLKYGLYGVTSLKLTSWLRLVPRIGSWFQGPSFEFNGGTGMQFILKEKSKSAIELGVATRLANRANPTVTINGQTITPTGTTLWTDALIFNVNYIHSKFIIGLSYDFNVSDLNRASNGNGAYEVSVAYLF